MLSPRERGGIEGGGGGAVLATRGGVGNGRRARRALRVWRRRTVGREVVGWVKWTVTPKRGGKLRNLKF